MAVEIGALRALLSLDSAAFESGAKRAKASMSTLQRVTATAGRAVARAGRVMAVGVTAAVAGISAGAVAASRSFQELANQARIAGLDVQDFKVLSLAAREFGIEQEKLADILKDVNDKFGDYAATGAGPLADFFENIAPQVGLTMEAFEGLSSSDALQLYVSALEDANVSQAEMTFYMEALASDATALVPLFRENGAAIAEMAKRAEELGLSLDGDMVEAAARARAEFGVVADVMKTQLGAAMAEIMPALAELAESVIPLLVQALKAIEPVISSVAALLRGDFKTVWTEVQTLVRATVDLIVGLLSGLVELARQAIADMVNAVMAELTAMVTRARDAVVGFGEAIVTTIQEAAVAAVEAARQLGVDLIEGLRAGIAARFEAARASITGVGDGLLNRLRGVFESQSPSRATMRIGRDLMDGLAIGITENAQTAAAAAASAATQVVDAANQATEAAGPTKLTGIFDQLGDAIADAIVMGKDLGESLKKVFQQIARDFIASGIKQLIGGLFGGGGGSSGGGILGGLIGSIFGGARAMGGPVAAGRAYLVGERGPELFMPTGGGRIVPNHVLGGGGGMAINVTVSGARGNAEVAEMVREGVFAGLSQYDRRLPERVTQIRNDPRARF